MAKPKQTTKTEDRVPWQEEAEEGFAKLEADVAAAGQAEDLRKALEEDDILTGELAESCAMSGYISAEGQLVIPDQPASTVTHPDFARNFAQWKTNPEFYALDAAGALYVRGSSGKLYPVPLDNSLSTQPNLSVADFYLIAAMRRLPWDAHKSDWDHKYAERAKQIADAMMKMRG